MNKNDIIEIAITDMGDDGEGIGKTRDGVVFFVKDAIVGDFVRAVVTKVMKNFCYAKMLEVLKPSPDRVSARCAVARACGGCQFQELDYASQLRLKREKVIRKLRHIGHIAACGDEPEEASGALKNPVYVAPTIGMDSPWRYRNKTQLPVGYDRENKLVAGFYAGRTHAIIAHEDCLLADEGNTQIANIVLSHMERCRISAYDEISHTGLVRHLLIRKGYFTGQWMVCIVINGRAKDLVRADELVAALREIPGMTSISLNINTKNTNVILGQETILLFGSPYIEDRRSDRQRGGLGPVLRHRDHLPVSGAEGEKGLWSGDRSAGHRKRTGQCAPEQLPEHGIHGRQRRGRCAAAAKTTGGGSGRYRRRSAAKRLR